MIETHELDAIKQEVASALIAPVHMHTSYAEVALEAIDRAVDQLSGIDPAPFAVGRRVELIEFPALKGIVARRIEADGELHTVVIQWATQPGEVPYSPSQVREISS